jgi:hypothetical protein
MSILYIPFQEAACCLWIGDWVNPYILLMFSKDSKHIIESKYVLPEESNFRRKYVYAKDNKYILVRHI